MLIDENNSTTDHKCDCGKPNKEGNFECNICKKYFCEVCPNGPLEENCLECMMVEMKPRSSTPIQL